MADMTKGTRFPTGRGDARLDAISKAIIEHLQEDGRKSYASIATAVAPGR